ncbi:MAG: hypothetical protein J6Y19_01315, partial [Kiritimatiellae bacterium]|nr:hypothetical protein [Kiritimatiellia bacterium]
MRICDLAKELMTTSKELLQLLHEGKKCEAKSPQANLSPELEAYLRAEIRRIYYGEEPAAEAPAA